MSAPRKIWTVSHADEYGQYFPEAVEAEGEYGGTAVAYHHDDVVRELVEALRYMVNHAEQTERKEGIYWEATNIARAALAKIAQHDS